MGNSKGRQPSGNFFQIWYTAQRQSRIKMAEGQRSGIMAAPTVFFAVLRKLGGPRTQRFITANFGGPDEQTSQRFWSVRKHRYMPGFNHADETATYLEQVYAVKKKELGITHPVLCELSEDETNQIEEARWNAGRNAVVGT